MDRKVNIKKEKDDSSEREKKVEKEKPNFGLSGKLTEETNTFRGIVIKYSEPPEARKPQKIRWRLYPFKGTEALPVMYIHRQSAYLLGRERKIADIPIDHPSCSKQHAAIQYRLMPYERPNGTKGRRIRPYIIDLESANGTFVNGVQIESKRYIELFEKDILKFGFSSREYVILHEESKEIEDESDEEGMNPAQPMLALPPPKEIKSEKEDEVSNRKRSVKEHSPKIESKVKKEKKDDHMRRHRDRKNDEDNSRSNRDSHRHRSDRDKDQRRHGHSDSRDVKSKRKS